MILGFTGTRAGLTTPQLRRLSTVLAALRPSEVRHGDCQGADSEFHKLAVAQSTVKSVVIHPPADDTYRAFCATSIPMQYLAYPPTIKILEPKPYLVRDSDIVLFSDALIACPKEFTEQRRGGTWYTVRQARAENMSEIYIIFPDGSMSNG